MIGFFLWRTKSSRVGALVSIGASMAGVAGGAFGDHPALWLGYRRSGLAAGDGHCVDGGPGGAGGHVRLDRRKKPRQGAIRDLVRVASPRKLAVIAAARALLG